MPKQNEKPMMGLKTTKNFVTQNAVENIMSVPKKPEKNMVDTRNGHVMPLEESGLQPKYRERKVSKTKISKNFVIGGEEGRSREKGFYYFEGS